MCAILPALVLLIDELEVRHLTMTVYADPRFLEVAGALHVLPELPLEPSAMAHTGT